MIATFAKLKAEASLQHEQSKSILETGSKGLTLSVKKFEVSHPILVEGLDVIFRTLSRLGV